MRDGKVDLNPNHLVRHLGKRPEDFTKEDLIKFVRDKEIQAINFRYVGGDGKLKTLKIAPVISFPGIFVRKGRVFVWIDEATHVPVLMHVDIPVGSVSVTLTETEKAPLKALEAE